MSQPPTADGNDDAARRQPPPPTDSGDADLTQRVPRSVTEPGETAAPGTGARHSSTGEQPDPDTSTSPSSPAPGSRDTADGGSTSGASGDRGAGAPPETASARRSEPASDEHAGSAPEPKGEPGGSGDSDDDDAEQTRRVPAGPVWPSTEPPGSPAAPAGSGRQQWPTDDSTDTPPTGMRALPRQRPWEDMETPAHGIPVQRPPVEPAPRPDRLWVNFVWEALLLLAVAGCAALVINVGGSEALTGEGVLENIALQVAAIGLLATGLALSLRVAAPNLAVGAIAGLSGATLVRLMNDQDYELGVAALLVLLIGAGIGLALAVIVVGLHVPAWAATLGATAGIAGLTFWIFGANVTPLTTDSDAVSDAADQGWLWFAVFAVISIAGGALWAVPSVRARLCGTRSDLDPARRPGVAAGLGATVGLIGSSVLAAGSGILTTIVLRSSFPLAELGVVEALAIVLVGGVSAFGRRGGVFGVVLAACALVLVERALVLSDNGDAGQQRVLIGGAVILGLVVTRLIEAAGNRRSTGQARPAGPPSQPGYPGQPGQSRPAGQPPGSGPVPRGGNQA